MSERAAGCDLVVALGRATVDNSTLVGHNRGGSAQACQGLRLIPGRPHELGETVRIRDLVLPQVRQTHRFLAGQSQGIWGAYHGVNEHGVAACATPLRARLQNTQPGLLGTDLVRLVLERSHSAAQGIEVLTDLLQRHGQAAPAEGGPADNAFLIADAQEAFAIETAGRHWVYQNVQEVRALSDVPTIRQDWDRIAPGLAQLAIDNGWWKEDGSKLDFADAVAPATAADEHALRRWGKVTMLLGEQCGHIETSFLRRLLGDSFEEEPYREPGEAVASLVTLLHRVPGRLQGAWCAFGPPGLSVFLPVFVEGQLPEPFARPLDDTACESLGDHGRRLGAFLTAHPEHAEVVREALDRLQARFDHEADEFAVEGTALIEGGDKQELERQAGLFMQHCVEHYLEVVKGLVALRGLPRREPVGASSDRG